MSESNPFAGTETGPREHDDGYDEAASYLMQTRPWLFFLGILAGLGAAMMIFMAAMMVLAGGVAGTQSGLEGGMVMGMGVLYLFLGLFYAAPAWFMIAQAMAISGVQFEESRERAFTEAMRQHRNLFRFSGIITLVFMVLYCGGIMAMVTMMPSSF